MAEQRSGHDPPESGTDQNSTLNNY